MSGLASSPITHSTATRAPHEALEQLDRKLACLARGDGALRLRVGQALERMKERRWYAQLGFSSIGAYVRERCNQPARWGNESMLVARRLVKFPLLRAELSSGRLGWSMTRLLAAYATPQTEAGLIAEASCSTFRQLRARLRESGADAGAGAPVALEAFEADRASTCLTLSLTHDEAWTLEAARWLFSHMHPVPNQNDFVHCVTSEGVSSLVELIPGDRLAEHASRMDEAQKDALAWRQQLRLWREEAEARVESRLDLRLDGPEVERVFDHALEDYTTPNALDAHLREICHELASADLSFGALAEQFWKSNGWRRLGYASEQQYARERLAMSSTSVRIKRAVARKTRLLPAVSQAVEQRRIGYFAALLLLRVATENTVDAWVARAAERTFKHLREEVDAAELAIRMTGKRDQQPPAESELEAMAARRQAVIAAIANVDPNATFAEQARTLLRQMSVRPESQPRGQRRFGRLRYRFFVSRDTRDLFESFSRAVHGAADLLPDETTPARLLFSTFLLVWRNQVRQDVAYAHIYARDGHRCQNPLCDRRDVTPHHLKPRSRGGSDDDDNVLSVCTLCHLELIHVLKSLRADPPASDVRWVVGKQPIAVVQGRKKIEIGAPA